MLFVWFTLAQLIYVTSKRILNKGWRNTHSFKQESIRQGMTEFSKYSLPVPFEAGQVFSNYLVPTWEEQSVFHLNASLKCHYGRLDNCLVVRSKGLRPPKLRFIFYLFTGSWELCYRAALLPSLGYLAEDKSSSFSRLSDNVNKFLLKNPKV